jgi:3'(2'), 5'-bisphosphate nucleotidase
MSCVRKEVLEELLVAAVEAGGIILDLRHGGVAAEYKKDGSPVTRADQAAEEYLLSVLRRYCPGVPIIAEEEMAAGRSEEFGREFFLVDPLDGTKEYIGDGDDFTVNIGLIRDNHPVLGIVYAPARETIYWGDVEAKAAFSAQVSPAEIASGAQIVSWAQPISCRSCAKAPLAVASKSHATPETEQYLTLVGAGDRVSIGSSLKFVLIASGQADVYPRAGPTMEWDTAAGDAVLRAAGGLTYGLDGQPFSYGKANLFNPGFLASGDREMPPLSEVYAGADPSTRR